MVEGSLSSELGKVMLFEKEGGGSRHLGSKVNVSILLGKWL